MSARRCVLCAINYPTSIFSCSLHDDEPTQWVKGEDEDPDWADKALRIAVRMNQEEVEAELIPSIEAEIKTKDSRLVLHAWDVVSGGVRHRLKDTDLIRVSGRVYEILGYHDPDREYWVRLFSMTMPDKVPSRWRLLKRHRASG